MTRTVIVGGTAAGTTVAARLRRLDETAEIILYEKNEFVSSAVCGFPYYIGNVIRDAGMLRVQTARTLGEKFKMDVRTCSEVISISPQEKNLQVKNLKTGEIYSEHYDNLVLATGTVQNIPANIDFEAPGIFTLRTVSDAEKINAFIGDKKGLTALVYGSGFAGVEIADNLQHRGINTVLVGRGPHALRHFDRDLSVLIDLQIKVSRIRFLQETVIAKAGLSGDGTGRLEAVLSDGTVINPDFIVVATGNRPDSRLAEKAGIALNDNKTIRVDSRMRTSVPDVCAVGDVIEFCSFVSGMNQHIALAGPAYRQARVCADNIAGLKSSEYHGAQNTAVIKINDLTAAYTGMNTDQLEQLKKKRQGFDYVPLLVSGKSHAGFYPRSVPVIIKAFFDKKQGRLLGAQAIGGEGIDKRIDVLAGIIRARGTYQDLAEADFCYAPPFSAANDVLNFLGFMADNYFRSLAVYILWDEVEKEIDSGNSKFTVLDVREAMETGFSSFKGAVNIPLGELRDRLDELPKNNTIAVTCAVGVRAYNAARILMQNGFNDVRVICGGMHLYRSLHWKPY